MLKQLLKPEIKELIEQKNWRILREAIIYWPPPDIADLLEDMEVEDALRLFLLLPKELAADVFTEMEKDLQIKLLQQLTNEQVKQILMELFPDERTALFEVLPGNVTNRLLNLLPPDERREALQLLGYPEDSVGRLMTPDYVVVKPHWTIARALEHIRKYGKDAETINIIYVIDKAGHLLDDIPLRKFILADPEDKVESLMDWEVISISAYADQEEAVKLFERYDLYALPVVDQNNILLGIVTADDIVDVIEEEVTEDIQKAGGVTPLEISYTAASPFTLYKKRVFWLSFLAVSGFLTSTVIAYFQNTLSAVIALAFFIPVLIGTGGNTSNQVSALVIRALATGELTLNRWFEVVKKELVVGFLLGITIGILLSLWGYWKGGPQIGPVVGVSVILIVIWSNLVGGLLPIILTRIGLDPAFISSPLLSTLLDITGLLIYFMVANVMLLK